MKHYLITLATVIFCTANLAAAELIADFTGGHERFSVYQPGERVALRLSLNGEFTGNDTLKWTLCDYRNLPLDSGTVPVTAEQLKKGFEFTVKNQKAGCFFLYMKLEKNGITIPWKGSRLPGYVAFGVLPELKALPLKYSDQSRFGGQGTNFIKTGKFMQGDFYAPFYPAVGMNWAYNGRSLMHLEKTPGAFKPKTVEEYKKGYPGWGPNNKISYITDFHGPPTHLLKFPSYFDLKIAEKLTPVQTQAYPLKDPAAYSELIGRAAKDTSAWREAYTKNFTSRNYYQIHWEPDWHWNGTEDEFLQYYEAAKKGIAANDPNGVLMGANYGVISRGNSKLERLFQKGLGKQIGGILTHLYFLPVSMEPEDAGLHTECRKTRELADRYIGPDAPIINTEWGTDYHRNTKDLTHELLMNHLYRFIRGHVIALGEGFSCTWFFYTTDYCDYTSKGGEQGYGMSFNTSSYIAKYKFGAASIEPKPTMMAAAAMTRLLEGTKTLGKLDHLESGIFAYTFRRGNENLIVAWSPKKERTFVLETGVPEVKVYDIMGNPSVRKTNRGMLTLKLDQYPQYIAGISDAFLPTADRANTSVFLAKRAKLAPGNEVKQLLRNKHSNYKLSLKNSRETISLTDRIPPRLTPGCYEVQAADANGKIQETMQLDISGLLSFGKRTEKVTSTGEVLFVQEIRNLSSIPQTLKLKASYGGKEFFHTEIQIPAEKSVSCTIPAGKAEYDGLSLRKYRVVLESQAGIQAELEWFGAISVPTNNVPVAIDGDLHDWSEKLFSRRVGKEALTHQKNLWHSNEDFSCRWQLGADQKNLYLAVEVKDDLDFRQGNSKQPWRDDSLILVLGRDSDGNGEWQTHRRFSITRDASGKTLAQEIFGTPPRGVLPIKTGELEAAIKRNDAKRTTSYEIRIPLAEFGSAEYLNNKENKIGLGFSVHDIDSKEEMIRDRHREISILGGVPLFMGNTRFSTILIKNK